MKKKNWCSHYLKQYGDLRKKILELLYDLAIRVLSIYPKNIKILIER